MFSVVVSLLLLDFVGFIAAVVACEHFQTFYWLVGCHLQQDRKALVSMGRKKQCCIDNRVGRGTT